MTCCVCQPLLKSWREAILPVDVVKMELSHSHLCGDMVYVPQFGGEDTSIIELDTLNVSGR